MDEIRDLQQKIGKSKWFKESFFKADEQEKQNQTIEHCHLV